MKPDSGTASPVARLTLIAMVGFAAISTDMYLSGIPQMARDLGVGVAEGQLTLSLFMIGFAVGQLVFGPLSDHFGRKPVATVGISIYVLASAGCALAPDIGVLLTGRLLQGFAASAGPVIARAIVRDRFQGIEAARVMSQLAGAMAAIPLIAPVFGSWLLYFFDWRSQFVLLLGFALVTLAGLRRLDESCPSIGIAPLALAGVLAQFGRCLRRRAFVGYLLCGSAAFAAAFTWISSASWIVIELLGVSAQNFGYTFMIAVSGYMGGALLSARLVARFGVERTLRTGVGVSLLGSLLMLALALGHVLLLGPVLLSAVLSFLGGGLVLSNAQMGAISEFPMNAGGASAVFGFSQNLAGATAGWAVGQLWNATLLPMACTMLAGSLLALGGYLTLYAPRRGAA
jgi:DHA1 family bicyclomycin/chloramphenicol resistance-like MFS transporter